MICKLCGRELKAVSYQHLFHTHNITTKEYKEKFPGAFTGTYSKKVMGEEAFKANNAMRSEKIRIDSKTHLRGTASPEGHAKMVAERKLKFGVAYFSDEGYAKVQKASSDRLKGKTSINKGKTKYTNPGLMRMSIKRRKHPEGIDYRLFGWTREKAQEIRLRDHFECQRCGNPRSSQVHHRDGDRCHNDDSNLVTLCRGCHQDVHMERDSKGMFRIRKVLLQF